MHHHSVTFRTPTGEIVVLYLVGSDERIKIGAEQKTGTLQSLPHVRHNHEMKLSGEVCIDQLPRVKTTYVHTITVTLTCVFTSHGSCRLTSFLYDPAHQHGAVVNTGNENKRQKQRNTT